MKTPTCYHLEARNCRSWAAICLIVTAGFSVATCGTTATARNSTPADRLPAAENAVTPRIVPIACAALAATAFMAAARELHEARRLTRLGNLETTYRSREGC